MKIICKKSDLQKSISIVSKAVSSKTTMPILETILINASAAEIHFTANDMELGIDTIVEGTIQEKGMVALDAKLFSEIVRKLPENDVIITSDTNNSTQITCEKAKFSIMGQSGEDFPYLPYVEKDYQITISQFTLKEVIRQTIFSIAANDSNKIMTGELFDINGSEMRVVSLDGHRISIRKILLKSEYEPKKVIVPGKTLTEISKRGWGWKNYTAEANTGKGLKIRNWMRFYLTYILPLVVLFIFLFGLYDKFFTNR